MKNYPIYVAGEFIQTKTSLEVSNPYDNISFAQTYLAGEDEFETAITAAQNAKETMANLPVHERYNILKTVAQKLEASKEELGLLLAQECGKPLKYAIAEIERAVETFLTSSEEAKRLPGEVMSVDWTPFNAGKKAIVQYFPVGIVAGIAPFNFPMNLVAHKVAPAIAAGCPIILKPASSTPLSALKMAEILDRTSLPKGALSVMPMDRTTGNKLVTDDRFNLLSFTGSPVVGWKMKQECGKKKTVLELGGNAGAIITADTDIEHAINRCLIGAFSNNGQSCIHTQRIFVHKDIFKTFTDQFVEKTDKLVLRSPQNPETDVASMIDEKNAIRVEAWVNEAVKGGAKLLIGGTRKGSVYTPTVLTNTKKSPFTPCANARYGCTPLAGERNLFDALTPSHQIPRFQLGMTCSIAVENPPALSFRR